jgi:hypothetical protein
MAATQNQRMLTDPVGFVHYALGPTGNHCPRSVTT